MSKFLKLLFFWQKPKIAVLTNGNLQLTKDFIARVLGRPFLLEKKVLVCNYNIQEELALGGKKYLLLNYDDDNIRKIKKYGKAKIITFGFRSGADFRATDIKINGGVNFKIDFQGNIVPVWLTRQNLGGSSEDQIPAALAAAAVGEAMGINLVQVSEVLRA